MKNNVILSGKSVREIFKGIFLLITLFAIDSVNARNMGAGENPATAVTKANVRQVQSTKLETPIRTTSAMQPSAPQASMSDLTLWVLEQSVPWTPEVRTQVNQFWGQLSSDQQKTITNYYNKEQTYQELQAKLEQLQQKVAASSVPEIEKIEMKKPEERGWFSFLSDYQPYLAKYLPQGGLTKEQVGAAAVIGTAATIFLGPTIAGYLGLAGALQLASGAYLLDRVGSAIRTGSLTTSGAIQVIKNGLELQIMNSATYPTLALKVEALKNGNEFLSLGKVDESIFNAAKNQLISELVEAANKRTSKEKERDEKIHQEVMNYRKAYGSGNIPGYIQYLEGINDSDKALAYVSEYVRNKNKVAIAAEKKIDQVRVEEEKAKQAAENAQKEAEAAKSGQQQPTKKSWLENIRLGA